MAIVPATQFLPAQILPGNANYPWGEARNVTSAGAGNGTPWQAILLNDLWGFFQKLLYDANITPSGFSDNVNASQYYDAIQALIGVPPGAYVGWMADASIPDGWLAMDGSSVSRITYSRLFTALGEIYGPGDGVNTFNLPNVRGRFARFLDQGAGIDPNAGARLDRGDGTTGDNVGTKQSDIFKAHTHLVGYAGGINVGAGAIGPTNYPGLGSVVTSSTGSSETRPTNIAIIGIIKY